MVLSIIFLEDKHIILLHLSIFYEYEQFFQHCICFSIQPHDYSDPWPRLARSSSFFLNNVVQIYEFTTQSLFADLRFVSIYLWQNKRIGENGPSLMRHIYKRLFSKIEELRNYMYVEKKNGHRNNAMNS